VNLERGVWGSVWPGTLILRSVTEQNRCLSSCRVTNLSLLNIIHHHSIALNFGVRWWSPNQWDSTVGRITPMSQGFEGKIIRQNQTGHRLAPFKLRSSVLICPWRKGGKAGGMLQLVGCDKRRPIFDYFAIHLCHLLLFISTSKVLGA